MNKGNLENINRHFFRRKKTITLVTTVVLGLSIVTGTFHYISNNRQQYGEYNGSLEPKYEDRVVWSNHKPEKTQTVLFTYHPSNFYKLRVYKGLSEMTHYRIEIGDYTTNLSTQILKKYGWQKIPDTGLVTIDRNTLTDIQYGHKIFIRYGKYNFNLCKIEYDDSDIYNELTSIIATNFSKEDIEKYNKYREKMKYIARNIINEKDTDFDKVKKIYDFVIDHIAYNFRPHAISSQDVETDYENIFGTFYSDCSGYTDMVNSILNDIGIESFSCIDNTNGHIWNIVNIDGKYYHLDATYSDIGSWDKTSKYRYFLVSDDYMRNENRWFIKEKDVFCNETYDLTGIIDIDDTKYRGFK